MSWLNFTSTVIVAVLMPVFTLAPCFAQNDWVAALPDAKAEKRAPGGPRAQFWSGFDVTAGMPFPSTVGGMLGINIGDDARLSFGAGNFGRWTTYQLFDAKFFLGVDHWVAYLGGGLDYMHGQAGKFYIWDLGFSSAFVPYIQVGLDYQADSGFHLMLNLAGSAPSGEVLVLPGIGIGCYF
jgi:hypothetical protein